MFDEELKPDQKSEQIICEIPEYMFNDIMQLSAEFTPRKTKGRVNRRDMLEVIVPWWLKHNQEKQIKPVTWECDVSSKMLYGMRSTINMRIAKQPVTVSNIIQEWYFTEYQSTVKKISVIKAEKQVEEAQRVLTVALDSLNKLKREEQVPQPTHAESELQVNPLDNIRTVDGPPCKIIKHGKDQEGNGEWQPGVSPTYPVEIKHDETPGEVKIICATPYEKLEIRKKEKPSKKRKRYYEKISGPQYTVLKPDGTYENCVNLTAFCTENSVSYNSLRKRADGTAASLFKGFFAWRIGHPDIEKHKKGNLVIEEPSHDNTGGVRAKQWMLTYPDGKEAIFKGLVKVKEELGFTNGQVRLIIDGKMKGYKLWQI